MNFSITFLLDWNVCFTPKGLLCQFTLPLKKGARSFFFDYIQSFATWRDAENKYFRNFFYLQWSKKLIYKFLIYFALSIGGKIISQSWLWSNKSWHYCFWAQSIPKLLNFGHEVANHYQVVFCTFQSWMPNITHKPWNCFVHSRKLVSLNQQKKKELLRIK